jgi:murein DD-endopeptidase MepM/ murein hydrolase activator NlpD
LEYQSGWVFSQPDSSFVKEYPMGYENPSVKGLYKQLIWAVNQLSIGYYAYREGRLTEIEFKDGSTIRLAPDLNAGTAALQYYFAQIYTRPEWEAALDPEVGFPALHARMFGDPWERARIVEPLFPPGLRQPALSLPFVRNWQWSYTGGPHGAWEHDGAYAAVDFAPGSTEGGCVESSTWVTASAPGLVVRTGNGLVVVDLDGDGREQTGWVMIYLHVSTNGKMPVGTWVDQDDVLGRPSCEGGVATGTHVHVARKYNGEWIPADGPLPFNLGGWIAHAGDAPYKGTLTRDGETVTACTCANAASVVVRTSDDP